MTGQEVLSKVFTTGDRNDNYINMNGTDISTAQLSEPCIALSQMNIQPREHFNPQNYPERLSFKLPLVTVNDYRIPQTSIINFNADYSSFLPKMMIEFFDTQNEFLSTAFPKEGSTMQLYIGGNGDEKYYKPIRQDFIITNITRSGNPGTTQRVGGTLKYKVTGTLSVPAGSRKETWCDSSVNARQALFNLSVYTGLGFATNFTKDNSVDVMQWNNEQNRTLLDFMKDIAAHACYSQYSFFTSFVDQYYVFNFIECHSLLSHGGSKTDTPAMIYSNFQQTTRPEDKNTEIKVKEGEDELDNTEQKVSYYFLTNNEYFSGWSNYIEVYSEINNGSNTLNDGYRVHLAYADSNTGDWGCNNTEFVLSPIDNLKREGDEQQIAELPEKVTKDSYIPLNLSQTTNHTYLDTDMNSPDNIASLESFTSAGEVDTTNSFKLYYFAKTQNDYQMRCLKKCGLHVRLQNYNPSITKFSRIWVDIYDKNMLSSGDIKPTEINERWSDKYKENMKKRNDDILFFPDEAKESAEVDRKDPTKGTFNRALSGWYVVTEMKIVYDRKRKTLQTELMLNRIEYKPNLKSEYELARKSINEKYRFDNTTGSWFNAMDDGTFYDNVGGGDGGGGGSSFSDGGGGGGDGTADTSAGDGTGGNQNGVTDNGISVFEYEISPANLRLANKFASNNGINYGPNQKTIPEPADCSIAKLLTVGCSFYSKNTNKLGEPLFVGISVINGKIYNKGIEEKSDYGGFVLYNDNTFKFCIDNSTFMSEINKGNVKYAWQNLFMLKKQGGAYKTNIVGNCSWIFRTFCQKDDGKLYYIVTEQKTTLTKFCAFLKKHYNLKYAMYMDTNGHACYGWARTNKTSINGSSKKIKNGIYKWGGVSASKQICSILYVV